MIERILTKLLRLRDIRRAGGGDYLKRWILWHRPSGRSCYIHKFCGGDWSPDLHDHPKWFVSVGLRGGYMEQTEGAFYPLYEVWAAPWVRKFPAEHRHRVSGTRYCEPCWTLVITGPNVREWGFYDIFGNFTHHSSYLGEEQ